MSRFLFCLLILEFCNFIYGTDIVSYPYGDEIVRCNAKFGRTRNKECKIEVTTSTPSTYNCKCWVDIQSDFGKWEIQLYFKSLPPVIEKTIIFNETAVDVLPGNAVYADYWNFIRIYMHKFSNMANSTCYAHHNGIWYNLTKGDDSDDIELYGECGIQLKAQADFEGDWHLVQESGFRRNVANFTLTIARNEFYFSSKPLPDVLVGRDIYVVAEVGSHITVIGEEPAGEIRECLTSYFDRGLRVFENSNNQSVTQCGFYLTVQEKHYGDWELITLYRDKATSNLIELRNNIFLYEAIEETQLSPTNFITAHEGARLSLKIKNCESRFYQTRNCRLYSRRSRKEYKFSLNYHLTNEIRLVKMSCCNIEIAPLKQKHYGEWFIEIVSGYKLIKANFVITQFR